MSKGEYTMEAVGPYVADGELNDKYPPSEAIGDRDENDLAVFGKRPQLKVRSKLFCPPASMAR